MSERQLRPRTNGRVHRHEDAERDDTRLLNSTASDPRTVSDYVARDNEARRAPGRKEKVVEKECSICISSLPVDEFPIKITAKCKHTADVCRDCVEHWCQTELASKNWASSDQYIGCPRCRQHMSSADIKTYAGNDAFNRYKVLKERAQSARNPDYYFCQAPNCESAQLHRDKRIPMMCKRCEFVSCVSCGGAWHNGMTCQQNRQMIDTTHGKDESETSKRFNDSVKTCPGKNCSVKFEKDGGCSHMTCTTCNTEFCGKCLVLYKVIRSKGNTAHLKTCENHPSNVRPPMAAFADVNVRDWSAFGFDPLNVPGPMPGPPPPGIGPRQPPAFPQPSGPIRFDEPNRFQPQPMQPPRMDGSTSGSVLQHVLEAVMRARHGRLPALPPHPPALPGPPVLPPPPPSPQGHPSRAPSRLAPREHFAYTSAEPGYPREFQAMNAPSLSSASVWAPHAAYLRSRTQHTQQQQTARPLNDEQHAPPASQRRREPVEVINLEDDDEEEEMPRSRRSRRLKRDASDVIELSSSPEKRGKK